MFDLLNAMTKVLNAYMSYNSLINMNHDVLVEDFGEQSLKIMSIVYNKKL